jgi:autotransporter-associated beta strand protein
MTIISGVISGSGGLTKGQGVVSTGTLQLNATNTFTGALTISNTTLALGPNGAVSNAANIFISAGGTFDVSALSSPYILSSSTTLNASGTGTIVGSTAAAINGPASGAVNLGAQPINLTFDGSDPALYIPQGALTLNGNLITVNPTEPLSPGTYTLIQVAGGIINGAPSTNAVVLGAGVENGCLATIQSSGGTVSLVVASQGNLDQWNGADYGTSHDWGDGANWANGTPPNLFGDDVTFAGSTGPTPVMDNSYTVFSLTFANGSSPFTLTAASTNVLTVSDGVTNSSSSLQTLNLPVQLADYGQADQTIWDVTQGPIAVTGVLSDTGRGLAVTGGNTLALSNLNTYTGGTVISNGATVLANTISDANCSIGPSGSVVVGAGSTFTYTGTASTATSRTFTFTGGAGNLNVPSGVTLTLGSVKSASSGIGTLGGGGTVILGGNTDNSSLGMTVGSGSTLVLDKNPSASTAHALGGTTTTISSGALLQVAGPGSYQIYSTGILLENSGGAIDFDGQSDSFSTLTLAGTGINNGGALLNSATGTTSFLTNAGSGVVLAGNTTIGGPGNIYMNSKVTGAFALTYAGTGTLTLGAVGAYSGGTTVNAGGTLQLTAGGVISNSAGTGSITLNGNGILSLNMTNTEVNSVITGGSTSSINIKMGNGNLWLSNSVAGQLNNFSGTFNVNSNSPTGGQLVIGSPTATETINPGATWQIQSSVVVDFNVGQTDPATVYLYGAPYSGGNVGALRLDDSVQSGPVILMGNTQIGNGSSAGASTISGVISSPGGYGFAKMGADPIALSATNTYSGATTISAGALLLSGNGSISNSSKLSIAAGTTFDVSALNSTTFALSSSTSLSASGTGTTVGTTAASINGAAGGTVNLGAQPISLTFTPTAFTGDSTHPSLYIAQGALTLGGNTITVSNAAGTRLGAGVYTLIQVAGGSISGAPATAVAVTGTGLAAGTSATLSVSGGSVIMTVVAAPLTKPAITGVNVSGTTLTITATNGTASGNYVLLESTNVGLPTTNWIPVLTNTFDINGNINLSTNIVNPAVPREFYIIENP